MIKNRNVLIIILILATLILGIVLACVLLRAQNFDIQVQSSPAFKLSADCSDATDSYRGKSILFLDVNDLKRDIERIYPYARVEKIQKEVSNTVTVKITERYEFFCIRTKDSDIISDEFIITDRDLKVLRTGVGEVETFDGVDRLINAVIPSDLLNTFEVGQTVTFKRNGCRDFLTSFSKGVFEYAENEFEVRQTFSTIEYVKAPEPDNTIRANCYVEGVYGCSFVLSGANEQTEDFFEKMFFMFYEEYNTSDRESKDAWLQFLNGEIVER